jgi:hypothetical protein
MIKLKFIPLALIAAFLIFWLCGLLINEVKTLLYGKMFPYPNSVYLMCGEMNFMKVLDISDANARIYFVSGNRSLGTTAEFTRNGELWECESWGTVWSSTGGSADEFVWPYWYHSASGWALFLILGMPLIIASTFVALMCINSRKKELKDG